MTKSTSCMESANVYVFENVNSFVCPEHKFPIAGKIWKIEFHWIEGNPELPCIEIWITTQRGRVQQCAGTSPSSLREQLTK